MSEPARSSELLTLEESTCLALIGTQHVGRLVIPGDDPQVVVLNFAADGHHVVFRTEPGALVEAVEGRTVVFEVDMYDHRTESGWSVLVRGTARRIAAEDAPVAPRPWAPGDKACWVLITASSVTGRLLRGEVPSSWTNPQGYL